MCTRFLIDPLAAVVANFLQRNTTENIYLFWQSVLVNVGRFFVLAYGGWRVYQHQLTAGDVVMFVAFLDKLYDPIDTLTSHYVSLQNHKLHTSAFPSQAHQKVKYRFFRLQGGPPTIAVLHKHVRRCEHNRRLIPKDGKMADSFAIESALDDRHGYCSALG